MKEVKNSIITAWIFVFIGVSVDVFYNFCNYNAFLYLSNEKESFFSFFVILLIFFIFLAITKKTSRTFVVISIILLVMSSINQLKIIYTDNPLSFTDIHFLENSSELIDIVDESLAKNIQIYIPHIIIYATFFIICNIISHYNNCIVRKKTTRIILFVIPIIILFILFIPNKFINNSLLNLIFDIDSRVDYDRITSNKVEFAYHGVISGMYQRLLESRIFEPDTYNEEIVKNEFYNISSLEDDSFGTPNIIVLFAESFWDIDLIEEVKFDKKITSNFEILKQKGIFFNMITPSYGGISANVEFEFLTGANMVYFPEGYIPTMRLYNDNSYHIPSITEELKNNGYRTKIVNYTPGTSFNINDFYKNIYIDEAEFNTNIDKRYFKGEYISDEYVVDEIISEFNNKPKNEKLFYMTLSMQSHMTYLIDKYENYDIQIKKSTYSEKINETLLSYAQGIYDMDMQLKRLYDYIQNLEEPTIIVFYGDHLPYLKTADGEDIMDYLKYFNTDNQLLNNYRKYNTQALILSNFEIKEDNRKYLSPNLLGTYIINKMNIDISPYYKWLNNYVDIIPAANWFITMDNNGNLYSTDKLDGELKEKYKLRENVQYYHFVDNRIEEK